MAPPSFREHFDLLFKVGWALIAFLAYYITAELGQIIHATSAPAIVWPAAGIALAAFVLGGYRMAIPIAAAAFIFGFFTAGQPLWIALILAIANAAQPALTLLVLRRFNFQPLFYRLSDSVLFVATAAITGFLVPTVGILIQAQGQFPLSPSLSFLWGSWWLGEMLSLLIVTPFLLTWLSHRFLDRIFDDYLEVLAQLLALAALTYVLFWTPYTQYNGIPLLYLLLIPFIWITFRSGPRIMTAGLLLITIVGISGILYGPAAISGVPLASRLFAIELFLNVLAVLFLLFVSMAEERKEATKALRRTVERLEQESLAKNDFLAALAHELRNPLAPVLTSLELMRMTELPPERIQETIAAMQRRVRTISRLLEDLLDISRISREKLSLKKEPLDLRLLIERAVETVEHAVRTKDHTLRVLVPEESIYIDADPVRIEQVVVNLLGNAIKYTSPKGVITIALEKDNGHAVITVEDTGVGISPDIIDTIFEPFVQAESARRMGAGLGIGLALTKNLVELHGGTIKVKSGGIGLGTAFTIHLPRLSEGELAARASETEGDTKSGPLSVLVVDDNRAAADALTELLKVVGHEARAAYDGAGAEWEARAQDPDVILLDLSLPDTDGYTLGQKLRDNGSKAAFVALTGYGSDEERARAKAKGFAAHLTKPVGINDLERTLREVTNRA